MSDKPCDGCPWLRANQTPAAVAASPLDGRGQHWFEKANLRRHWAAVAGRGAMLPCHKTDAHAPLYGGRPTRAGHEHICVGLTVLASREVRAFMEAGTEAEKYRKARGRRAFSMTALASWAARLLNAGATFHIGHRSFRMPSVTEDQRVTVPWADVLHAPERVGRVR